MQIEMGEQFLLGHVPQSINVSKILLTNLKQKFNCKIWLSYGTACINDGFDEYMLYLVSRGNLHNKLLGSNFDYWFSGYETEGEFKFIGTRVRPKQGMNEELLKEIECILKS